MEIPVRVLRYFAASARFGSIAKAAEALNISQPSVSMAINRIEAELDVQLFVRRPSQGIRLTSVGTKIYEEARQLLAHVDSFHDNVSSVSTDLTGEITLACFVNLAPMIMAGLLDSFRREYPSIRVNFAELNHRDLIDGVLDGTYELAIGFDLDTPPEVEVEILSPHAPHFILSPTHPLAGRSHIHLAEMVTEPYVLMDLPYTKNYFLSLFENVGVDPKIAYHAGSYEMVRCLVGAGHGYGILNIFPKHQLTYEGTRVVSVPIADAVRPLNLIVLRHPRIRPRLLTSVFIEHIRTELTGNGLTF
jgi:DNA-binding transcriptional LysR family regulator